MHHHLREAAAWRLAAELVREHPGWVVTATDLDDGPQERLCVAEGADHPQQEIPLVLLDPCAGVTLPGHHDVPVSPAFDPESIWETLAEPAGLDRVMTHLHTVLGRARPRPRPQTTPQGLGYRVIAALLAAAPTEGQPLEMLNGSADHDDLLRACPDTAAYRREAVWIAASGTTPVAHFAGGFVWTAAGERLNLPERRARGHSIPALAAAVLDGTRPTRRGRINGGDGYIEVPPSRDIFVLAEFALTYNGYELLAKHPHRLYDLVAPIIEGLKRGEAVPPHVGLDLARAALFYLQRGAHHGGWLDDSDLRVWAPLVERIRELSGGRVPVIYPPKPPHEG